MRCRADRSAPTRGCPRNGKRVRAAPRRHCRTLRSEARRREGGRSRLASPETGLRPGRGALAWRVRRRRVVRRSRSAVAIAVRGRAVDAETRHVPSSCIASRARRARRVVSRRVARRCARAVRPRRRAGHRRRRCRSGSIRLSVTATRGSQPIADVLADVTVIGARRDRARRRAEPHRAPAAPAGRRDHPERRTRRRCRASSCAARTAARRWCWSTASGSPRRRRGDVARGDPARPDRPDRDPARAGVEPLRRRRDRRRRSRCSRGAGPAALSATRARATARTRTWDGDGRRVRQRRAAARSRAGAAAKKSNGFNAIVEPGELLLQRRPRRLREPERLGERGAHRGRTGRSSPRSTSAAGSNNQFDGGPGFDDRTITTVETWQVASRNRLASFWVSRLSAGAGIDDSVSQTAFGDFPFKTTQRQYAWQNELTLPLGLADRRPRAARGARRDRRRISP